MHVYVEQKGSTRLNARADVTVPYRGFEGGTFPTTSTSSEELKLS